MFSYVLRISNIIIILSNLPIITTQHLSLCDSLHEIRSTVDSTNTTETKLQRIRALCDAIHSSKLTSEHDELDLIPDFDLTQIASGMDFEEDLFMTRRLPNWNLDNDANQILKRFRRGRSGGGRSGGGRSGGGRFSSSFSRSSSSGGSRFFGGKGYCFE